MFQLLLKYHTRISLNIFQTLTDNFMKIYKVFLFYILKSPSPFIQGRVNGRGLSVFFPNFFRLSLLYLSRPDFENWIFFYKKISWHFYLKLSIFVLYYRFKIRKEYIFYYFFYTGIHPTNLFFLILYVPNNSKKKTRKFYFNTSFMKVFAKAFLLFSKFA